MNPLLLTHFTATSCAGRGLDATLAALAAGRSGLAPCDFEGAALETWTGRVAGVEDAPVRADLAAFDCRNNRLAQLAMMQDDFEARVREAIARVGANRIGVFMGTSTAGILETELAYQRRDTATGALPADFNYANTHNPYSLAAFVRAYFGLRGPAVSVSSACSSGAKVFGSARRMLETGLIDAAVVGGVDTLCLTTLYGFNSLELLAPGPCKPFDVKRDGISIGEAAAFALLEPGAARTRGGGEVAPVLLLGAGESSDAYHMSAPHPQGRGARTAMERALAQAALTPGSIDYINFHGTGTASNDEAEAHAVAALLGTTLPGSSTKGATGHALGAAGALEAVICALALQHDFMPAGVNTTQPDPALAVNYLRENRPGPLAHVMSNSFGFGGSNCTLIFGRQRSAA